MSFSRVSLACARNPEGGIGPLAKNQDSSDGSRENDN
jgi:hypothetical protein